MDTKNPHFFYDVAHFPSLHFLAKEVKSIQKELAVVMKDLASNHPWVETFPQYVSSTSQKAWQVFPFTFYTMEHRWNQQRCPKTSELLRKIPELISCDFSRMKGRTTINPHRGYSRMILRCHLPLLVPKGAVCGIKVGHEIRMHEEGKLLIFDDSYEHSAWNDGAEDRVVLMFDIPNPLWGYNAREISQFKLENLDDPFLLQIASKESWLEAFRLGTLPMFNQK